MAVFEQKTPDLKRRDVSVEDIAPNIRYVHLSSLRSITLTLSSDEADDYVEWCVGMGIVISRKISNIKGGISQFIMLGLLEREVTLIKLGWARHDIASSPRML